MSAGRGLLVTNKTISDSNKTGYEAAINTIYSNWRGERGSIKEGVSTALWDRTLITLHEHSRLWYLPSTGAHPHEDGHGGKEATVCPGGFSLAGKADNGLQWGGQCTARAA